MRHAGSFVKELPSAKRALCLQNLNLFGKILLRNQHLWALFDVLSNQIGQSRRCPLVHDKAYVSAAFILHSYNAIDFGRP